MPRRWYKSRKFSPESSAMIDRANTIIDDYRGQGFVLTLRQLYYQFVARGLLPNRQSEYKRLGSVINDARLAGLIDWDAIVDMTRNLKSVSHWDEPSDIIETAADNFRIDKWAEQPEYLEVWIEKDALVNVIEGVCKDNDVSYFSCRGYTSQSEMWSASQRLLKRVVAGKTVRILHLGDHDPSGLDMSRDIEDRIRHFLFVDLLRHILKEEGLDSPDDENAGDRAWQMAVDRFSLDRLALNWDQIQEYDPPPNPAKLTDARARGYIEEHGNESWELDALEPQVISDLIEDAIIEHRDEEQWNEDVAREDEKRTALALASERWTEVEEFLTGASA